MSGSGGESMPPPPVYAMPMGGHHPQQQQSHNNNNNKYQNVYSPYSTPVVQMHPQQQQPSVVTASAATPPSAGYPQPYHQQGQPPVHSGHINKPLSTHTPPQGATVPPAAGSSSNDTSSTTSTPLQKSPPTQMPETSVNSSYDKKPRRGPTTELSGSAPPNTGSPATTQQAVPPPRTTGYLGNNYNSAYARNPNQTYTPRGYAPKKHYSTEGTPSSAGGQMGQHGKPLVLNTPMHQSSPSPGIYNHYHPSQQQQQTAQGGPNVHGIRGPRPKPANLDLRRTGSHYQSANATGGVSTTPVTGNQNHSNSQRNTPSTNSTESNNSPNSVTGGGPGGNGMEQQQQQQHSSRGQMGYYPNQATGGGGGPHHSGGHPLMPLMGSPASHPSGHPGMYVKLAGQTYFPHVSETGEGSRGRGT